MSDNSRVISNRDTLLENFAADLTCAVFPLALRYGMNGSWLDLQMGLWRVLAETVKKWVRERPPAGSPDEIKVWREGFLVDLTERAFYVALKHGIKGSLLEVELGLYRTFRLVVRRHYRTR